METCIGCIRSGQREGRMTRITLRLVGRENRIRKYRPCRKPLHGLNLCKSMCTYLILRVRFGYSHKHWSGTCASNLPRDIPGHKGIIDYTIRHPTRQLLLICWRWRPDGVKRTLPLPWSFTPVAEVTKYLYQSLSRAGELFEGNFNSICPEPRIDRFSCHLVSFFSADWMTGTRYTGLLVNSKMALFSFPCKATGEVESMR